jgi:hypothetical protein
MKSLRNAFKASDKLETEGVFLELANTRVRLARAGGTNTRFNAAMTTVQEKHKRALVHGLMSEPALKNAAFEVWAKTVVISWETNIGTDEKPNWVPGIDDGEGGVIDASVENIIQTFHEMPDFFLECKNFSENIQWYREALLKEAAGN